MSAPAPRQDEEYSEGEGDADPPSQPGPSPSQPTTKKTRRSPGGSGMQEVILRLLEDSQKSQKAAEKKVNAETWNFWIFFLYLHPIYLLKL